MKFSIKSQEDFLSGLMFIGFGLFAVIVARDYPMGSAMRMGPGYFPTYLGVIMIVIGAIITLISLKIPGGKPTGLAWRPLIALFSAFLVYGVMMENNFGFVPSIAIVVLISSFSIKDFRPLELVILTSVLVLGTTSLFIWGLELPYPLFWWSY
ncbi:MAG TPA: tripartite tricarboxylate transporter TctB family protein [Burkholderiales bacterium]|nr:tripartite tricarboxylate transporter TctB family protein [Burkholderiales bacterium]